MGELQKSLILLSKTVEISKTYALLGYPAKRHILVTSSQLCTKHWPPKISKNKNFRTLFQRLAGRSY